MTKTITRIDIESERRAAAVPPAPASRISAACRRALDIALGVLLVLLTLPVAVIAAIGAAVTLRSWPFFRQQRIGLDERPFTVWKIKTLPDSTPSYASKYDLPTTVPRFTQLLRDLHIDELPQLLLVVAGTMSLVGPRPEMAVLHDRMPRAFARERTSVRPGCTGLWQISPDCVRLIGEAPEYDLFYVRNRTMRLDLWIAMRTLVEFPRRHKRTTIASVPAWTGRPQGAVSMAPAPVPVSTVVD